MKKNIYRIINLINNKSYIGQTGSPLNLRFSSHITAAKGPSTTIFHMALNDLGKDHFKIELLEICDEENAAAREQYYINKYDSQNPEKGYNTRSPEASNKKVSQEELEKLILELYTIKRLPLSRISKQLHKDHRLIKSILKKNNIEVISDGNSTRSSYAFKLTAINPDTKKELSFENQYEAAKYIESLNISKSSYDNILKKIQMSARGIGSGITYGFIWRKDSLSLLEERKKILSIA